MGQTKRFGAMTTSRGSKAWSCHDTRVSTESCRKYVMCSVVLALWVRELFMSDLSFAGWWDPDVLSV